MLANSQVLSRLLYSNGPEIPFRAGRVDATKAGPAGVPEPHQTLEDHTAKFAKQGFTPTEMIQLIACVSFEIAFLYEPHTKAHWCFRNRVIPWEVE
jgi:hypothetical protein